MIRTFFTALALIFCVCCTLKAGKAVPYELDSRPPRSIKISEKIFAEFTEKTTALEIVAEKPALKTLQFAAGELKRFLDKRLKTDIPVLDQPSGKRYAIILGTGKLAQAARIGTDKLCRDAFIIRTVGKNIYIAGNDSDISPPQQIFARARHESWGLLSRLDSERGTLFGVYDFLERFAGIRFYFPTDDFTVIPTGKMIVPETNIFDRPDFEARYYSAFHGDLPEGADADVKRRSKIPPHIYGDSEKIHHFLRTRMQTRTIPFNHGLHWHFIPARFGKTHPEYFARLNPGDPAARSGIHLCLNRGLAEVIKQDIREYYSGKKRLAGKYRWMPEAFRYSGVNLTLPDGMQPCRCPRCDVFFRRGSRAVGDMIWKFASDMANFIKKEKFNGYATLIAYHLYNMPPPFDLPENLWVMLCQNGPWSVASRQRMAQEKAFIASWHKKTGRRLPLWNYSLKYKATKLPNIPNPTPRAFAQYYKELAPLICGAFNETGTDRYIFNYMTYYMFGRVAWDNSADPDKILAEHYRLLYGKAAGIMQAFFDELEEIWIKRICGDVTFDEFGPRLRARTQEEIWKNIYTPEKIAGFSRSFAQAEQLVKKDPLILRRLSCMKRNFLLPLQQAAEEYRKAAAALDVFSAPVGPMGKKDIFTLDGKPDEVFWQKQPILKLQKFKSSAKQTAATEVRAVSDGENLYISFVCSEHAGTHLKKNQDALGSQIEIFLQAEEIKSECLQLMLLPDNTLHLFRRIPGKRLQRLRNNKDIVSRTAVSPRSWSAEIRIPLKNIKNFNGRKMRANFARQQGGTPVLLYSWSPFVKQLFYEPENFGLLEFGKSSRIVRNGDFSQGRKYWGFRNKTGQRVLLDKKRFVSAGCSLSIETAPGQKGYFGVSQDKIALKPGKTYLISFSAAAENIQPTPGRPGMRGACFAIRPCGGAPLRLFPVGGITGTSPWKKYDFKLTVPSVKPHPVKPGYFCLWMMNASGRVFFDNISIVELR